LEILFSLFLRIEMGFKYMRGKVLWWCIIFSVPFWLTTASFGSFGFYDEAIEYRNKGFQAQTSGNLDKAMEYYQKAIALNPHYATAYNDLGVVYELKGWPYRAEREYIKAIQVDPNCLSSYSNLALLYEKQGNLERAALYWLKRAQKGKPFDPWTRRARDRLRKLGLLESRQKSPQEGEFLDVQTEAALKEFYEKGKEFFARKDYMNAILEFKQVLELNPDSIYAPYAQEYIKKARAQIKKREEDELRKSSLEARLKALDEVERRLREQKESLKKQMAVKRKEKLELISNHYKQGVLYYRQGDYRQAKEEFEKIFRIIPGKSLSP
jgi:Flp pilus assembly protein TadD